MNIHWDGEFAGIEVVFGWGIGERTYCCHDDVVGRNKDNFLIVFFLQRNRVLWTAAEYSETEAQNMFPKTQRGGQCTLFINSLALTRKDPTHASAQVPITA